LRPSNEPVFDDDVDAVAEAAALVAEAAMLVAVAANANPDEWCDKKWRGMGAALGALVSCGGIGGQGKFCPGITQGGAMFLWPPDVLSMRNWCW
jgi:hypothetical protein